MDEEHIAEFKEAFKLFDRDGGGTISRTELTAVMKSMGMEITVQEAQEMMNEIDKDGDGDIDFPEFIALMSKQMIKSVDKQDDFASAFTIFDRELDDTVSFFEVSQFINQIGSDDAEKVIEVLRSF